MVKMESDLGSSGRFEGGLVDRRGEAEAAAAEEVGMAEYPFGVEEERSPVRSSAVPGGVEYADR